MNLGWIGGARICELGPREDVQSFFANIERHVVARKHSEDWSLITDRLYQRYVALEDNGEALALMRIAERVFHQTPFDANDASLSSIDRDSSQLEWAAETLGEAYAHYFDTYVECAESIEAHLNADMEAQPLRIIITDTPQRLIEELRPLEVYDAIDPPPLWIVPLPDRDLGDE